MCEFTDAAHKKAALQYFSAFPEKVFNPILLERFPFAFQQGRCPVCGAFLESHERRPQGRATRSMCSYDYENLIVNGINSSCLLCVGLLAESKVRDQYRQPREVTHHLHEGECMNLWTLIHNVSVSEPDVVGRLALPTGTNGYLPAPGNTFQLPFSTQSLQEGSTNLGEIMLVPVKKSFEAFPTKVTHRGKRIRYIN
jgi:hypothetical protein